MRTTIQNAEIGLYSLSPASHIGIIPCYVFDVKNMRDPIHKFRDSDGSDPKLKEWMLEDPRVKAVVDMVRLLVLDHVDHQGCSWMTFGFLAHHERWQARGITEIVADALSAEEFKVAVIHGTST